MFDTLDFDIPFRHFPAILSSKNQSFKKWDCLASALQYHGRKEKAAFEDLDRADRRKWRTNMQDKPIEPMNAENVDEFDVWIFDSQDLVVSVVPLHAPLNATTENYDISHL